MPESKKSSRDEFIVKPCMDIGRIPWEHKDTTPPYDGPDYEELILARQDWQWYDAD